MIEPTEPNLDEPVSRALQRNPRPDGPNQDNILQSGRCPSRRFSAYNHWVGKSDSMPGTAKALNSSWGLMLWTSKTLPERNYVR